MILFTENVLRGNKLVTYRGGSCC